MNTTATRRIRPDVSYWAYLVPGAALFLAIIVLPFLMNLYFSVTHWPGLGVPEFVGLENYTRLFKDDVFWLFGSERG